VKRLATLAFALFVTASVIQAQQSRDPDILARIALMQGIEAATETLGDMTSGRTAFDADRAAAATLEIASLADQISAAFTAEVLDSESGALPVIWADWQGFTDQAADLATAARAVRANAVGPLRAGLADIGATCRACHSSFRQ
jgi:cytochrome c556